MIIGHRDFKTIQKIDSTGSTKSFPKSAVFPMSIADFLTFFKINSILEFSVPIRVFWYVTRLYLKRIFFFKLYLYRGSQTLKSEYSRNIGLRKKNRNSFWSTRAVHKEFIAYIIGCMVFDKFAWTQNPVWCCGKSHWLWIQKLNFKILQDGMTQKTVNLVRYYMFSRYLCIYHSIRKYSKVTLFI